MHSSIIERLEAQLEQLRAAYRASAPLSSASKGWEREALLGVFLNEVFPPHFRFGRGDIVGDQHRSGQIDIVVEHPDLYSFPSPAGVGRLYMAAGVGAAIEVKSGLIGQWKEVVSTAEQLARASSATASGELLREAAIFEQVARYSGAGDDEISGVQLAHADALRKRASEAGEPAERSVPLFVVGFKGWKNQEKYQEKLGENPCVTGILSIEPAFYAGRDAQPARSGELTRGDRTEVHPTVSGGAALLYFLDHLHRVASERFRLPRPARSHLLGGLEGVVSLFGGHPEKPSEE